MQSSKGRQPFSHLHAADAFAQISYSVTCQPHTSWGCLDSALRQALAHYLLPRPNAFIGEGSPGLSSLEDLTELAMCLHLVIGLRTFSGTDHGEGAYISKKGAATSSCCLLLL